MRSSGILLNISSLPSNYGVGDLEGADKFVAFLVKTKQKYWQILPPFPLDTANSPYASPSAFAGNFLFIDIGSLVDGGLLTDGEAARSRNCKGIDYAYAAANKEKLLRIAAARFYRNNPPAEFLDFCEENSFWLDDYALFFALKKHFGGQPWYNWQEGAKLRDGVTVAKFREELSDEIDFVKFVQFVFFSQWQVLREKLCKNGIKLIGDIPMYVAYDSADVWANRKLFDLDANGNAVNVAGVPPDYFSSDGQLWGNPVYNWHAMKKDGYAWWIERVKHCEKLFDVLRIDHFRAFDSYYCVKYGETMARRGMWKKGEGYRFVKTLIDSCENLEVIAEDLGDIPDSVYLLRDKLQIDGMKVMQFAFDGNPDNLFLPQHYNGKCVAYLGTHDNDTTLGWWKSLDDVTRKRVSEYLGGADASNVVYKMMCALAASESRLVIYTMQDVANQDTDCRMNTPGTTGCWQYMADNGVFSNENAKRLLQITELYKRD
ncbi:MAG: 4-alpha-glucanotransferase [Corallococcus sp.]|nr:4-alpha-glucanotransferase [Corallococcus sp.]